MNKKALEKFLLQLREENRILKEENAYLKFELEELRAKRYKSGRKKPLDNNTSVNIPKKRGGLFGHIGWLRKKPDKIDRTEEVRLSLCPGVGKYKILSYTAGGLLRGDSEPKASARGA